MSPDVRRARVGVSVVFGVCGAAFATWAARVAAAQQRLGLSAPQLAVALFGLAVGSVLTLIAAGPLITTLGSRTGALIGATVLCLGLPLVAIAPNLPLFVAALFVLGVGNSLLDVSMNAHAARVEQAYGRPIFASFHAFWNIGGLAGSGLGALFAARHVGIGAHFTFAGVVLLVVAWWVIGSRFLTGADSGQGGTAFALPSRALLPLGVIAFCGFVAEGTVNDWSAVYLTGIGAGAAIAPLAYFVFSAAMIGVRLVADRLTERIGVVHLIRVLTTVAVAGFALLICVAVPSAGLIGFGIVGLGVSAIVPMAWSAAGRATPDSPGGAIAAVATCGFLGFLTGPVLIGGLAGLIGLRGALIAAAAVTAAVVVLAPALRPRTAPPATTAGRVG